MLFLHHPLADDLVDGGLGEGTGDDLAGPVALSVVGDAVGVGPEVAAELGDGLEQLALFGAGVAGVEVELDVFDGLQRAEDVAVPAEPLEPCQLGDDAVGGHRRWGCAQSFGELGQHGETHRDVEPVQEVFGLRVQVQRQVAYVVGAVGEEGDLLVGLPLTKRSAEEICRS